MQNMRKGRWSRDAYFRKTCRKYTGPLVAQSYELMRLWMKGRERLRVGFSTLIRVAKGTSYVHAYEVVEGGEVVKTIGTPQIED
jgi:hypothetical protein